MTWTTEDIPDQTGRIAVVTGANTLFAGMGEQGGHPQLVGTSGAAQDTEAARRLWEISEELTQVHPTFGRAAAAT